MVIGVGGVADRPFHARGKVVLKGVAPAPNRGLVRYVVASIGPTHRVLGGDAGKEVSALSPDRVGFAPRRPPEITTPPTSPIRPPVRVQPVVDQAQKRRRVSFHDEQEPRV